MKYAEGWGERIRLYRGALGMKQPEFAKALDLQPRASTVSDWERERNAPDIHLMHAMASLIVASDQAFRYLTSDGEMPAIVRRVRFTEALERGAGSVAGAQRMAEPGRALGHRAGGNEALQSEARVVEIALTVKEQWERVASSLIAHIHQLLDTVPYGDLIGVLKAEADYLQSRYEATGDPKILRAKLATEELRKDLIEWREPPGPRAA